MKIHIKYLLAQMLALVFCFHITKVQSQDKTELKPANITTGVLENGMHYYIMHNENPRGRAAMYFAQNVGSILEEENQRGLAHFLEHMAFNGTEHFKNKEMLEYLEKNGMKFGSEINASTHYDETIYKIHNIPVQNEQLLDSLLLILHDWSGSLTLSEEEIDNERGVVREEWRTRYTAQRKASDSVMNQGLLKGSRYAKRGAIGTMEVINNFEYEELRNYYKKWYRPDLQAVIIVGDIDEKKMEEKVKELFSKIPLKKDRPKRKKYDVKVRDDFTYMNIANNELGGAPSVEYYLRYEVDNSQSSAEIMKNEVKLSMLNSILDHRLSSIAESPTSPVYTARFSSNDFKLPKNIGILKITLQPKKDSLLPALKLAATELKRFYLYGATSKEFDGFKYSKEQRFKSAIKKGGSSNIYHAIEISEAFFNDHPYMDYKESNQYQLDYVKNLKNEDLLKFFRKYYSLNGNVVAILGSDEIQYPSKKEVMNTVTTAKNSQPEPYKEVEVKEKKLFDLELQGGNIISEEHLEGGEATKFILSNGARVWLYERINANEDIVFFKAKSPGGRSQLKEELLASSVYAPVFAEASGLANLNRKELRKSREVMAPGVKINEYEEVLERYVDKNNIENLLKGVHLTFTHPRFDDVIFDVTKQPLENMNSMLQARTQSTLSDSLQMAIANYSPREVHLNEELLNELSMEDMETVYRDRIKNAADFKFVFMGNLDREKFIPLIKKYIGSIPGNDSIENIIDHNLRPKKGIEKVHMVREMQTPQTTVSIYITEELKYNETNKLAINIIEQLLTKRYMERIREEEGGTYGVRVKGDLKYIPEDHFTLTINFNCNPDKADKLVEIVYEELDALSNNIDPAEFIEIKANLKKEINDEKTNTRNYFEKVIASIETNSSISDNEEDLQRLEAITPEDIKQVAKKINKDPRIVEGILMPEKEKI
ncbi:M16 family metallopeptidase [Autumnicola musiva]|uniref:Insulinase family protein n=1 Tax=Autumnicola musiva TaxID=3075589 RepID=A0ABU3D8U8_9FLAO|nr:insulinase family protein [Zunongwangia sp. F117]MDT0677954.1 insulinase family protein [Zunongwangia sp. F117]